MQDLIDQFTAVWNTTFIGTTVGQLAVAAIVLLGFWIERNLLVWPSVIKNDMSSFIGLVPVCIALGFCGAFILVFLFYSRVFPSLPTQRSS